jgi:tubulin beta
VACDEHGIGGGGEYIGGKNFQLGRINVLCHEASGGKYVPRAVLFGLEHGVIGAVRTLPLGELFRLGYFVNQILGKGNNWAEAHYKKSEHEFCQNAGAGRNMSKGHYTEAWLEFF